MNAADSWFLLIKWEKGTYFQGNGIKTYCNSIILQFFTLIVSNEMIFPQQN